MAEILHFPMKVEGAKVFRGRLTVQARHGAKFEVTLPEGYDHIQSCPAIYYFIASGPEMPTIGFCREKRVWKTLRKNEHQTLMAAISAGLIPGSPVSGSGCHRNQ